MSQDTDRSKKRHWFLAVWSVPQPGAFLQANAYFWAPSRNATIPLVNGARNSRGLSENAIVVNVAYMGYMTEAQLTGVPIAPVPTVTTAAYNLGLEQSMTVPDLSKLVNAFPESDTFNHQEWALGYAVGKDVRAKIVPVEAPPPPLNL